MDGDTIKILTKDKTKYTIRLANIDAPEKNQSFRDKSKENLENYIANKTVQIKYKHYDIYKIYR